MPRTARVFSRGQAAVHGIAAAWWLGLTLFGLFGDCRPRDIDGQCGMSLMFAAILGALGALTLLVLNARLRAQGPKPLRGAGTRAFLAGVVALLLCVPVGAMLDGSHGWQEAIAVARNSAVFTAFLGSPGVYALVLTVIATFAARRRRSGQVSAWWPSVAGAIAGGLLAFVVSLHWAYSAQGHAWMVIGGAWTGVVVGMVFAYVAMRGPRTVEVVADERDARNAI